MMQSIVVEQATLQHAQEIIELYKSASGRILDLGRLNRFIADFPSAVALSGDKVIGFGFCTPFAPDIVELGNLFVSASYRSLGVGSRILALIESRAKDQYHSIVLSNSMLYRGITDKKPASEFYQQNGYQLIWSTGPTNVFAKSLKAPSAI